MTDDILSRFKPGQRYTLAQLAKKHGVGTSSLQFELRRMIDAGTLLSESRHKATVYYVPHAAAAVTQRPETKAYRLPQVMLDQMARCVEARSIESKFN